MKDVQTTISNLVAAQFPEFYREEGSTFIAFIKAYYEWLEQNFQLLKLESNEGFSVGSVIRQGTITGTVVAFLDSELLVKVDGNETFRCFNICSSLDPVTTVTDGVEYSTLLLKGGTTRRLGAIFQARTLPQYRDIDTTIDLFINQFKEKYLKNIEFDTLSNKRLLVKNALDLYRSKGTERSIDLFFRLVYGLSADVRRPSDFLFQPSAAEWVKPTYLEISPNTVQRAISLVGKEITGVTSGAKAFVEKYIKIKTSTGFSHILYVSNVKGTFAIRELLKDDQVFPDSPTIYGSLNEIEITTPASEFSIGDIVELNSFSGINGLGRVVEVRFASGLVEFALEDGGYGFSVNLGNTSPLVSRTLVSDQFITLANVNFGNVASTIAISQPGTGYSNTDTVEFVSNYGRNAYGRIITDNSGAIVSVELLNKGSGFVYNIFNDIPAVITTSGGIDGELICETTYPSDSSILLETLTQESLSTNPQGLILGNPSGITIFIENLIGNIVEGDALVQIDPTLGIVASGTVRRTNFNLNQGLIVLENISGVFRKNYPIVSNRDDTSATLVSIESLSIPVKLSTSERFVANQELLVYSNQSGIVGFAASISTGENADFSITAIDNEELVSVNTDLLSNTALIATPLNAVAYGFAQDPTANVESSLLSTLTFEQIEIGTIRTIGGFNPGNNYSVAPTVLTYQPYVVSMDKKDLVVSISDLSGSFSVNELVVQNYTEAARRITVSNVDTLVVGESVYISNDAGPTIISEGIIAEIVDSNTIELIGLTSTDSFIGHTLRSNSDETLALTILSEISLNRDFTARGLVSTFDSTTLRIKRLSYNDVYKVGIPFTGITSGASANVIAFTEDEATNPLGLNSLISAQSITSDGSVAGMQVIDSGFGFIDGEEGTFKSPQGQIGTFRVINGGLGTGSGSYRSIKGFPSDRSKLFDGDYYQEYSYDIISRIPINKYGDMFKSVMHTAGTKFFGSVVIDSTVDISNKSGDIESDRLNIANSEIIVGNTSPYTIQSVNIGGFGPSIDPNTKVNLAPVVDFADINIDIRD